MSKNVLDCSRGVLRRVAEGMGVEEALAAVKLGSRAKFKPGELERIRAVVLRELSLGEVP